MADEPTSTPPASGTPAPTGAHDGTPGAEGEGSGAFPPQNVPGGGAAAQPADTPDAVKISPVEFARLRSEHAKLLKANEKAEKERAAREEAEKTELQRAQDRIAELEAKDAERETKAERDRRASLVAQAALGAGFDPEAVGSLPKLMEEKDFDIANDEANAKLVANDLLSRYPFLKAPELPSAPRALGMPVGGRTNSQTTVGASEEDTRLKAGSWLRDQMSRR
jgi:hypothetical protein